MDTYQITGQMVATNFERLHNPTKSAHADTFAAMMDNNLMEFRLLKDGVATLTYFGPKDRTHLTPEEFINSMTAFLAVENVAALEFVGQFLFIETKNLQPIMTQVVVAKTKIMFYEGQTTWAEKD